MKYLCELNETITYYMRLYLQATFGIGCKKTYENVYKIRRNLNNKQTITQKHRRDYGNCKNTYIRLIKLIQTFLHTGQDEYK